MFRKIHSNRDPRDTLFTEIAKEFKVYLDRFKLRFKRLAEGYPHQMFALMVFSILISLLISFSFPITDKKLVDAKSNGVTVNPITVAGDGLGEIVKTGAALKRTLELRKQIELIVSKDSLSHIDSLQLEEALKQLNQINQSLPK